MTRLPLESWDVKGLEGAGYMGNAVCAAPGCEIVVLSGAGDRHHLWRRSFLAGDYWWVQLPDGYIVGNVVWLCREHHRQVTKGIAVISLTSSDFRWRTDSVDESLSWQPMWFDGYAHWSDRDSKTPGKNEAPPSGICPSCGQLLPHVHPPERKREAPIVRRTWSIAVPVAEQENGAEVLDVNLEHIRELFAKAGLPYGAEATVKYHLLSSALALFIVHAESILDQGG